MTENKENMSIKYAVCVLEAIGSGLTLSNENDREDACVLAIQALEEIQQYRAIGTPTQIYEKIGGLDIELGKYHSIGTVDDLQDVYELCESLEEAVKVGNALVEELKKYQSIGTIEEFKALKEKSAAKKPMHNGANWYRCPNGCEVHKKTFEKDWYCPKCGVKLDWSE